MTARTATEKASSTSAPTSMGSLKEDICVKIEQDEIEEIVEVNLYNAHIDVSGVDERKLIRKIDWRLVPWLSFLFLLSFLDRTAVGNARLYGMEADLHITDQQYLIALTVFYFPYAVFEVPSNVVLKKLRPSRWLSILMLAWGVVMTCQGLVRNNAGFIIIRWFLGATEAGLFPGVTYLLSCWYKRSEFGFRAAVFFSMATIAGAFGGLLAAGLSQMAGIGGKPGWSWIFIIEGLATIVAGAFSFWLVEDFPDTATFLTEAERTFVVRRLQEDGQFSAAGEKLRLKSIIKSLVDWKTYVGMIIYAGSEGPMNAIALFLPSIVAQLGYTATPANLLTVPVYVVACIGTCLVGYLADRYGGRGYFNIGCFVLSGSGFVILICSRSAGLSYFACYLAACGVYPTIPNLVAWMSSNVEGSYKRSVTLGMVMSFGNVQGAVSSNVYRAQNAPWYTMGHGILLIYIGVGALSSIAFILCLQRENKKRDRGERDEVMKGMNEDRVDLVKNGVFVNIDEARREKGDDWSKFRYRW
ncbi:hypothetical protein POSPLADRAFT_1054989 [Postia placenta MAD-698-R-SB12]|uniref:Major facilitator superfamily (MFS) profile domain-containing protein n=1 Tax=Postia placenta MAD-698-R-SB12 TaxID=670580 RepID=A0A1X6N7C6_9APHY|nr:hypothetical protein POSPLADRAFT_1054989 [Postia placenta MAD-698-R-SB12]OSX64376.1 hypothetical protein POSPLADRAFT_1054989 [Postia placenta MAD-698-R-SB12]